VGIVTVGAFHQSFIDPVMKGLLEGSLCIGVAAIAQLRLLDLEQVLFNLKSVVAMAIDAAHAGGSVRGALKVRMSAHMATQASVIDRFGGSFRKLKNFSGIAT
jgi:hypothetical protein